MEWVKTRKRNEAFDLAVYALAAKEIIMPNYQALADSLSKDKSEAAQKKPKRRTSFI